MKNALQPYIFCLASLLLSLTIYGNAFWGASLLAPLDIGPDILANYRFMDPAADGIPNNHYIVDQFTYDLPLQYLIYNSYRRGEIPWWDPYTYGGRPLLADAHINGTDPIRLLCYFSLPFELAYNWTYILKGVATGLGMFLLLRHLRISFALSLLLALTYQFSGWFTIHFGHPWIQGSFLYYPYLWLLWMNGLKNSPHSYAALGAITVALIFYSGNLQSHTYLVLFGLSFFLSLYFKQRSHFMRGLKVVFFSGIAGLLIAAPVLSNQIEFYLIGVRTLTPTQSWWTYFGSALLSLGAFYPWMFGSFRTLDIGRTISASGMAYYLFCGIPVYIAAVWFAISGRRSTGPQGVAWALSITLVALFLVIIATPLSKIFYARCAPLAGMGLIVLAGLALQSLIGKPFPHRRFAITAAVLVAACATGSTIFATFVYPRFQSAIEQKILAKDRANKSFTAAPELRRFQVANFPKETSICNPAAATGVISALLFCTLLISAHPLSVRTISAVLICSAIPVIIYHARFKPSHDITLWNKLKAGGPAQNSVIAAAGPFLRIQESPDQPLSHFVFPNALSSLYRAHVIHGYSALQPKSLYAYPKGVQLPPEKWIADLSIAHLSPQNEGRTSRFLATESTDNSRFPRIIQESLNNLILEVPSLTRGTIVRTDTFYPGWRAKYNEVTLELQKIEPCFGFVDVSSLRSPYITFQYWPRYWMLSAGCSLIGFVAVLCLTCLPMLGRGFD